MYSKSLFNPQIKFNIHSHPFSNITNKSKLEKKGIYVVIYCAQKDKTF